MMRAAWIAGALAVLAGCPGGDPVTPDGHPDATGGNGGLTIHFSSPDQNVPGEVQDDRSVSEVRMTAASVRGIGDAAPGDERTTEMDYDLRWHEGDAPALITFDTAPVGLYSSVEVRLEAEGGGDDAAAFVIEGMAQHEEVWHPYRIAGNNPLTITVATSTELAVGGEATIQVHVDLGSIIEGIDFDAAPVVEETIVVEGDESAIRNLISAAFEGAAGGDQAADGE